MLERIPAELRQFRQWIGWRGEVQTNGKITKIPVNLHNGFNAAVDNPATWSTYDHACEIVKQSKVWGAGFVLTADDPYAVIDLDDTEGNQENLKRQVDVFHKFDSYSEKSPSNKGLHVFCRGAVPQGRKRSHIEVYSNKRFITMTGNVFADKPIEPRQELLTILWNEMGSGAAARYYGQESEQKEPDEAIIASALSASNGDKFAVLLDGRWQELYPSQSEADLAFIDIVAFYSQNREQISRIFRNSPLGQREKAARDDYLLWMINKSFDKQLPPIDFEGLKIDLETRMLAKPAAAPVQAAPSRVGGYTPPKPANPYRLPPNSGLLGQMADFIYRASKYPVPEIALCASIALMAGICGRAWQVSNTGLNMYGLLLAPTGTGKEMMHSGPQKIMSAVTRSATKDNLVLASADKILGPTNVQSGQALIKHLADEATCFVSIVGEFGVKMQEMCGPRADINSQNLRKTILELYMRSEHGLQYKPTIYSDRAKNVPTIASPAWSFFCESNPETFYNVITESVLSDGFLPRFLIIEYDGPRPKPNKTFHLATPTIDLIASVQRLIMFSLEQMAKNTVVTVDFTPEALQMSEDYEAYINDMINEAGTERLRHIWNRCHLKALKLAAVVAVGINYERPCLDFDTLAWAIGIVHNDAEKMVQKFESGAALGGEADERKQVKVIGDVMREYVTKSYRDLGRYRVDMTMHNDRVIPYSYLQSRLAQRVEFYADRLGATSAIQRSLKALVETGQLREAPKGELTKKYNYSGRAYMISDGNLIGV